MNQKAIADLLNFKPFDAWAFSAKNPEGKRKEKSQIPQPVDYDKLRFDTFNELMTS